MPKNDLNEDATGATILLVEDDNQLGLEIKQNLEANSFGVSWLQDGKEALSVDPEDFDLVVLDLMLPNAHGFDILKQYRKKSDIPVIILTARTDSSDKLRGFKLGSDDYMTKPFWPEELVARIEARLRRPEIQRDATKKVGVLEVFYDSRQIRIDGVICEFTKVEFDIVSLFTKRVGQAFTRRQIVDIVLDEEKEGGERTLDVHISRIRKKFGDHAEMIKTVWGVGYKMQVL